MTRELQGKRGLGREAKKRDKLARIRRAARDVFLRKGYEAATVREIATAADVAFGTLFLYVKDKHDLLLLLFDEELPAVTERAFRNAKSELPFVEQLIAFFSEFYSFFSTNPSLSRDMMREITFGTGIVGERIWVGVQETEERLARIVARAQAEGRLSAGIAPDLVAHIVFSLYRVEIRFCLNEAVPNISGSLERLRRQFEVLISGLQPARDPRSSGESDRNGRT